MLETTIKSNINLFSTNVPLLYLLKTSENWGIEVEHWLKIG